MHESTGALGVAATGLILAAVALSRFGLRQRSFRGWRYWVAALALGAGAMVLEALTGPDSRTSTGVTMLLLPWPVLTLIGLRRFHARLGLPADERVDWIVIGAGCAMLLAGAAWGANESAGALWPTATLMLVQFYASALLWGSRTLEDAGPPRLLGTVIALSALISALSLFSSLQPSLARLMAAAFGLTVMTFSTIMMMSERIERELRDSRRRLRVLANTDALTGVPNRRRFGELVERSLRTADAGTALLLIFDVDHFKLINDRLGHAAGDRALRLVGSCMNQALRAQDVAGRLGGDEFVLMLRGTTVDQALAVAMRIVNELQAQSPEHHVPRLGLSFGIARMQSGESLDDTLRRADLALYEAKRQGRSRAVATEGAEDEPVFSESRRLGLTA